jgi:prepilin-type N-terminal cleavage/methylation domain-containing protein
MGVNNQVKQKTQKGFTLIELLVVIAIIGLLASVVLVALGNARAKSRDAKRVADIRQIQGALELFFNDCNGYPMATTTAAGGTPSATPIYLGATNQKLYTNAPNCGNNAGGASAGGIAVQAGSMPGTLIAQLPSAPTPADGSCTNATDVAGLTTNSNNQYRYVATDATGTPTAVSPAAGFRIDFCVGAATGGLSAGGQRATQNGIQPNP